MTHCVVAANTAIFLHRPHVMHARHVYIDACANYQPHELSTSSYPAQSPTRAAGVPPVASDAELAGGARRRGLLGGRRDLEVDTALAGAGVTVTELSFFALDDLSSSCVACLLPP